MWICHRSGVSPCVLLDKFDHSNDFCVQVLIVPRVLYHSDEEVYYLFEQTSHLHKREILTGLTIAMLLGLGAAGTATARHLSWHLSPSDPTPRTVPAANDDR